MTVEPASPAKAAGAPHNQRRRKRSTDSCERERSAEHELVNVTAEVRRMLETGAFKPISLQIATSRLSRHSQKILEMQGVDLGEVLQYYPGLTCVWQHEGVHMVSLPGGPWLGPMKTPPAVHGPAGPKPKDAMATLSKVRRGECLSKLSELSESPILQNTLTEIAEIILACPAKKLLVSSIGNVLTGESRDFFRLAKLRTAQLLRAFPHDFYLEGEGPGVTASYLHPTARRHHAVAQDKSEANGERLARLFKLAADCTEVFEQAVAVSAAELRELLGQVLLVDCRSEAEMEVSILPGAVPASALQASHFGGAREMVAYCALGDRSAEWVQETAHMLPVEARYLTGGIIAWAHNHGMFVNRHTEESTLRIHGWTLELGQFFPIRTGYQVEFSLMLSNTNSPGNGSPADRPPDVALSRASQTRHGRLRALAWEVRMRYCPESYCLEAHDVVRGLAVSQQTGDSPWLLVDCRSEPERRVSTINNMGCHCMTGDQFKEQALEVLQKTNIVIIAFCVVGGRSGMWCERLLKGFAEQGVCKRECDEFRPRLTNLLGGVAGWLHAGGALVDSTGRPTRRVHSWCQALADLFPVEGVDLVIDEAEPDQELGRAFASIQPAPSAYPQGPAAPLKIVQMYQSLNPAGLADSLARAADNCEAYED
eukprot:TRINITY_DN18685_c0_g1_i1.p1 TRINITY_DN18685_c0_g1~~TRINITY_DN18685_c0_g1_i1.p1  ORF type:complete len:654 (+),score=110.89 TRINITY_DN18685_c0_g1_i1:74-2035(+)